MRHLRILVTLSALLLLAAGALQVSAETPASDTFERTWSRTDKPVADDDVDRTWMWGPEAFTAAVEEDYADAPDGTRMVQYYDKSRMEDNAWRASEPWDVTNGLLVVELMTGQQQTGDSSYEPHTPADIPVAGDPSSTDVPTYAALAALMDDAPHASGSVITSTVDHDGTIADDPQLADYAVTAAESVDATDHTVASPFWDFMTSTGAVYEDGEVITDLLFQDPFYATGYPVTEAHWTRALVGGTETDVLVQAFERRVLTYTPSNPDGWKVESGNVGRHYYEWFHGEDDGATDTPTPTPTEDPDAEPACDPAYPDFCIAPPPPVLTCDDASLNGAHDFTVLAPDPHGFDADGDGIGCEQEASVDDDDGGSDVPVVGPGFTDGSDWDGAVKLIDTNVADALVCVYAAGGVGQGGKPDLADITEEDCELLLGTGKGGGNAGQGEPDTYFANLGENRTAAFAFDDDSQELDVLIEVDDLLAGEVYSAAIAGFGCDLNFDGDCADDGEDGGTNAVCSPDAGATLPNPYSGDVLVDLGIATADADGDLALAFTGVLDAFATQQLGDFEDNVLVVTDDTGAIVACGIIESGSVGLETPEEAAIRLGAVVVGVADGSGDIAFGLPAGDYYAVINADGYQLAVEEFTLEIDETELNEVNLIAD